MPNQNPHRIAELDGLRGLAILLVIGFHYFAARPDLLPYGATFASVPLFKYGNLGVQMFFMISGYVIFMSLDASKGLADFARKRWFRLFPAMLIASVGILLTAPLLAERPLGLPRAQDVLPGLTFVDARWYRALGVEVADLEGAFWSLYVEVRFYVMAGVLYFSLGRKGMAVALAGLVAAAAAVKLVFLGLDLDGETAERVMYVLSEVLIGHHLAWFMVGVLAYIHARGELEQGGWLGVLAAAGFALLHMHENAWQLAAAAGSIALFLAVMWFGRFRAVFAWRFFTCLGAISYPLYLFHENAGIALIIKLERLQALPAAMLPLIVLAVMAAVAHLIAMKIEPALRSILRAAPRLREGRLAPYP